MRTARLTTASVRSTIALPRAVVAIQDQGRGSWIDVIEHRAR